MLKKTSALALCYALALPVVQAADSAGVALDTDQKRMSYAIGLTTAQSIVRQGVVLDLNTFMVGVADAMDGSKPRLTQEEFKTALDKASSSVNESLKNRAKTNLEAGQAYMQENAKKAGVTALSNGMQYKELRKGTGDHPKASDTVKVHYEGKERGEPATFPLNGVIQGWQEILPLMSVGARWQVVIPPKLAYGVRGAGGSIGPNETLVFEIELLEILK
jgi:FKBP-type peptidyl-prolyl cis-trans isomerase FklB